MSQRSHSSNESNSELDNVSDGKFDARFNELHRTLRRTSKEHKPGTRGLAVFDTDLPQFGFRVFPGGGRPGDL